MCFAGEIWTCFCSKLNIERANDMETYKNKLHGDGIHDDLPAIEERLNSGIKCLYLPCPKVNYLISGPITLHSGQIGRAHV